MKTATKERPAARPKIAVEASLTYCLQWELCHYPNGSDEYDWSIESFYGFETASAARADARRVAKNLGLRIKKWV